MYGSHPIPFEIIPPVTRPSRSSGGRRAGKLWNRVALLRPEPYAVGFYYPEIPSRQSRLQGRDNPERHSDDRMLVLSLQPQDDDP